MNKLLGRLFRPSTWMFFVLLVAFSVAAGVRQDYLLAGVSLAGTVLILTLHLVLKARRRKALKEFLEKNLEEMKNTRALAPFPMVAMRLHDGGIVYANDAFIHLTGYQDTFSEKYITQFLPGFKLDWMISGKTEYPYDVTLERRRFRVYGTTVQSRDSLGTWLGVLYFTDLTELYQVRDEYIRSRPVVSIILVDNYEELTKNLS